VAPVAEVLFYHLERAPLERVLPGLIEKTLQRGWRAVIQASSPERVEALDTLLWTYREDSFLPHGTAAEDNAALQPVLLTTDNTNPNDAAVRFLVDGATIEDAAEMAAYERVVFMFDGHDETATAHARDRWKAARSAGHTVTYWQQDEHGKWHQRA
jgi:DNA polymerase III subunit chi